MEIADRRSKRGKKFPKVPIKTYNWEELRRSRRRGGYPWTHLYKEPFYEHLNPEPWTMEGMRKAKSSSTMGKSEEFSISEVSTFDDSPSIDIKDKNHSIKTSCSSLNLEEQEIDDIEQTYEVIEKEEDDNLSPGMFFLHSEESSDDISQYLDKEERLPIDTKKQSPDRLKVDDEISNRKRKLSAESGGSKLSLGKKAILQKLKDTKDKIKMPKITFHTKLKKPVPKKVKNSPPEVKKSVSRPLKDVKPVYIHIPLKPPEGESDEYSHLENEPLEMKEPAKRPASFKDLVKTIKHLQEPVIEHKHPSPIREVKEEEILTDDDTPENKPNDTDEAMEIMSEDPKPDNDFFDKLFEASTSRPRTDSENTSRPVRSKSAEPERKRKLSLESSYSRKSLSKLGLLKKLRDAKDKIKNTLSRATSKKDINVKKEPEKPKEKTKTELKPRKNIEPIYIHIPLKPPEGQTDEYSHLENESRPIENVQAAPQPETETTPMTPNGNVQLIILTAPSDDEILDDTSSDVPETPSSENKLFFPLKVSELKEIAQDALNEVAKTSKPLTPVTEESVEDAPVKTSEGNNLVVDEEDGLSENKKEETVIEEMKVEIIENANIEEVEVKIEEIEVKIAEIPANIEEKPKVDIDETIIATSDDVGTSDDKSELKSVLRAPNSPVMKKKVSFKRRSKSKNSEEVADSEVGEEKVEIKEPINEDICLKDEKNDDKWSKISDHEQEPELPPPNNIEVPTFTLNNTSVILSTDEALGTPVTEPENYGFSTKHVYEEIAEGTQKKTPNTQKVVFSATTDSRSSDVSDKPKEAPNKFQAVFKQKADNLKSKFQNIKRPHINFPERPKFQKPNMQRFKIEKPKWNLPKFPDTAKINFSLPRRQVKRISTTESTSGDSKKPMFDFGTYPRIFKKKSKPKASSDFATVPRTKKTENSSKSTDDSRKSATDSIRIPLHSEDSVDKESSDLGQSSHIRYDEGIDSEDEYDKEITKELMAERDFLSRWQRGRFNLDEQNQPRITDLDSPSEDKEFSSGKDQHYSSGSSVGIHRQGVIEEINPDEFFLRQKGISQDNIEVGMYLSTEIREAFRNPTNALVQMEDNNFDKGSHTSLPDIQNKRKPIKKPKRKKTPHVSQERISYGEEETADEELDIPPPSRPKRRSKRKKKTIDEFIPYQETIQVEGEDRLSQHRESLGILADDEQDFMYENEKMEGIEQPEIKITNPYKDYGEEEDEDIETEVEEEYDEEVVEEEEKEIEEYIPEAPPRMKPKTINSLKTFEVGSAVQTFNIISTIPSTARVPERISYHTKDKLEPEPEISYELNITEPERKMDEYFNNYHYMDDSVEDISPAAPPRKQKSLKSLTISENDSFTGDLIANKAIFSSEKNLQEPQIDAIRTESKIIIPIENEILPVRPSRSRSRANSKSRINSRAASESRPTSEHENDTLAESLTAETPVPCVEEPCIQTVCDYMGYTTVDRNKPRDPPLPPPRTLQRKKRSKKEEDKKFFTVPRCKAQGDNAPIRPSRIYSTIAHPISPDTENKENLDIDILQYIEQDDNRDLQSGEVIEKIRTRPLPTPPRPHRKSKIFSDITSRENIMTDSTKDLHKTSAVEIEVYTQTEPLPDDFVCEEVIQEPTDRVIIPTQDTEKPRVKRELITPTVFMHEETITHGSLIVEPLNGAKILRDTDFTQRVIKVHLESDNEETSSIPEDFHKLSDTKEPQPRFKTNEMDVLKAHKLQVTDLDVETLTVNKLLADKIVVSEIDSSSIHTNEISSKTGTLKVGEISLPPEVLDHIIKSMQTSRASEEKEKPKEDLSEQKKTPIESSPDVESNNVESNNVENDLAESEINQEERMSEPETNEEEEQISDVSVPESTLITNTVVEVFPLPPPDVPPRILNESLESSQDQEPPNRPPRQSERFKTSQSTIEVSLQEPEVDDEPPPRPPQPPLGYIPSQPPSSFYALKAQKYVDENIPTVPRRRRHTKSRQLTKSSSEESSEVTPVVRRHHRRSSDPSLGQLSGQLVRACGSEANNALKRLITYILNNVLHNEGGKQDLNVMIIIVLVLIAGLLLLGYGEERTVVHMHHWEYFNPPKDL